MNKTHIFVYLAPSGNWFADMSASDKRHEFADCGYAFQHQLPFGAGADWRCVRDFVISQNPLDDVAVDILSR